MATTPLGRVFLFSALFGSAMLLTACGDASAGPHQSTQPTTAAARRTVTATPPGNPTPRRTQGTTPPTQATAEATATPTCSATPWFGAITGSPTATATLHAPDQHVLLSVGTVAGVAGATVELPFVLTSGATVGTQNDIVFPPGLLVALTAAGKPDCTVNPRIHKDATDFVVRMTACESGEALTLRALVLSYYDVDPIPAGSVLYTCVVTIADSASGTYPLRCNGAQSSDPHGFPLDTACTDGSIRVAPPS